MTTGPVHTEDQLREVLGKVADGVHAAPDAYQRVQREWRRRERKRRLTLTILVALVFVLADLLGLWALNQYRDQPHIVYIEPVPTHSLTQVTGADNGPERQP